MFPEEVYRVYDNEYQKEIKEIYDTVNGKTAWQRAIPTTATPIYPTRTTSLISLVRKGKLIQDGTPTPNSPIYPSCNNGALRMVDDELPTGYRRILGIDFDGTAYYDTGEKLIGSDVVTITLSNTTTTGQNVFGAYSGTSTGSKNFSLYVYGANSTSNSYLRYNETLYRPRYGSGERTISFGAGGTDGFLTDVSFDEATFESSANAYIGALPNSSSPKYTGTINGNIIVGTRLKYVPCERIVDNVVGYYEVNSGVFLEPQAGTPTFSGYDLSHLTLKVVGTDEILWVDDGNSLPPNAVADVLYPVSGSGSCVASCNVNNGSNVSAVEVHYYRADGTQINYYTLSSYDDSTHRVYKAFALSNTAAFVSIERKAAYSTATVTELKLSFGSSVTPYVTPQSATVEDLFAVGDYADEQEIISGAVTRRIGVYVFDGTETWIDGNYGYITETVQDQSGDTYSPLCTHYRGTTGTPQGDSNTMRCYRTSGNVGRIYIAPNRTTYPTKEDFAAFVKAQYEAGTPIIVMYPLATAIETQVTPQPLIGRKNSTNIVTSNFAPNTSEYFGNISYYGKEASA